MGGNGYSFTDDYDTKGCFAHKDGVYGGSIFYGNGGTIEQMKEPLNDPLYRPKGYDCIKEEGKLYFFSFYLQK